MWGTAERRFVRHVCLRNPFPPNSRDSFLQGHLNHEEIKESVSVDYWVGSHNPARTPGSMFESWISDRFEWFFVVIFLCPNLLSSLDPSNSYSCLSQWSFDYIDLLVSGLQGQLVRHLAKVGPMFPCNKGHEAKNNCGDWDFSHSGLEARLPAFQLPMFSKCDALPKGDLWEMLFFSGIYFAIFLAKTFNVRVDVWVVNQWWIRMIFRRKFCVPNICCPRSIQATHTHACHSKVSISRLFGSFGLWSPRPYVAASCKSRPHVSM